MTAHYLIHKLNRVQSEQPCLGSGGTIWGMRWKQKHAGEPHPGGFHSKICVCAHSLQPCPTLCDPMDCSPPGSSVYGDSLGKNTGVSCHALLQRIFPNQGSNPCFWCLLQDSLPLATPGPCLFLLLFLLLWSQIRNIITKICVKEISTQVFF